MSLGRDLLLSVSSSPSNVSTSESHPALEGVKEASDGPAHLHCTVLPPPPVGCTKGGEMVQKHGYLGVPQPS